MQQHIAIPSYFYPTDDSEEWKTAISGVPSVKVVIINPNSGPGKNVDTNYSKKTILLQSKGVKVVGYVHTQYGKRDISTVKAEVALFYNFYAVDGIFLDEIANTPDKLPYYSAIHEEILTHLGHTLTILNPGTQTCEEYMSVADIICNFESDYLNYILSYQAPDWIQKYPPGRFWHIVHSAKTMSDLRRVCKLSKERNAGFLFVTPGIMPNPYNKLPSRFVTELVNMCGKV